MPAYRSRTSTHGRNMAGARGLWRAKRALGARFFTVVGKAMQNPRLLKALGAE